MINYKVEKLLAGETIISKEPGNSTPAKWEDVEIDDIVYVKVHGNIYTHLVKGKDSIKGVLIGNNKGGINGWSKQVYGRVTKIL